MKKTYFLLLLAFSCLSFGQTNNTCSTATQVLQLPYTFDQTDGVTSPNDGFVTACTDRMNDGLWYSFTGDGGYVSIKATTTSDWNHQIGIYTGSCTDLVCSGTANSEGKGVGKVETLTISTVPGTIYYVNVGQYSGGTDSPEGNFKIGISKVDVFLAPTNDKCSTATKVTQLPYAWPQINGIYAANDGLITACSDGMNDGLWYSFTGDGNNTTIKATAMSDWNHKIGVYTGACTALVCAGTADNDDEDGSVETITIPTIAGTTYYVNVGYYGDSIDHAEGNFTIEITREASLSTSETSGSKANNSVKLYPNPFKDVLHISDITNIKSVLIYDISGKLIKTIDKPDSVLYLGELKQGTYLITLQKKDGSKQTLKAIKII